MCSEGFYKLFIFSTSTVLVFLKVNLILIDIFLLLERCTWLRKQRGNMAILLNKSIFLNHILLNSFLRILDIVYSKSIFSRPRILLGNKIEFILPSVNESVIISASCDSCWSEKIFLCYELIIVKKIGSCKKSSSSLSWYSYLQYFGQDAKTKIWGIGWRKSLRVRMHRRTGKETMYYSITKIYIQSVIAIANSFEVLCTSLPRKYPWYTSRTWIKPQSVVTGVSVGKYA